MTRVLFIGESATLAHIVRPLTLARRLSKRVEENFEIHFAADEYYSFAFTHDSFQKHTIYSRSPKDFESILRGRGIIFDEALLTRYVTDELELIRRVSPDIVIGDLRPSLSVSASVCSIPLITLTNAYWSPFSAFPNIPIPYLPALKYFSWNRSLRNGAVSIMTKLFQKLLPQILAEQASGINAVRKKHGLVPFPDYLTGFTWGDATLYCDSEELAPTLNRPSRHAYLGAVGWAPEVELPPWWATLPANRPMIYVSLGSSGDEKLLIPLLRALRSLDVSIVIATAGKPLPNGVEPNNDGTLFSADYLPGDVVARRASVVITNGGSPGNYQALSMGKPVLGVAVNMDQFLCMQCIEAANVGICVRADTATSGSIRQAVRELLEDPTWLENARRIGKDFATYDAGEILAGVIRRFVSSEERRAAGNG